MIVLIITALLASLSTTLAQSTSVTLFPTEWIVLPGASGAFTCSSHCCPRDINDIQWILNGTVLEVYGSRSIPFLESFDPDLEIGTLSFTNIPLIYNTTRIQCGILSSESELSLSNSAELLIQGNLGEVVSFELFNLTDRGTATLSLNWEPPFTLDVTGAPDITGYCVDVDVINSTFSMTLYSECGINDTHFEYILPNYYWCATFEFTVKPLNMAGNGSSETAQYVIYTRPALLQMTRISTETYLLTMTAPVCSGELTFIDLDTQERILLQAADLNFEEDNITFSTVHLRPRRHYDVIVIASNAAGSDISGTDLSTHDVIDATIRESTGNVELTTVYSSLSTARGALYSFVFVNGADANLTKSVIVAISTNDSREYVLPFRLFQGDCKVYVYDIEEDGTLLSGVSYPAVVDQRVFSGDNSGIQFRTTNTGSCNVTTNSFFISAKCIYSSDSVSGFQMIVQTSILSQANKLYINQSTADVRNMIATIEVEKSGVYLVSILPSMKGMGITYDGVEYYRRQVLVTSSDSISGGIIAGAVIGSLLAAILITCACIICCYETRLRLRKYKVSTTKYVKADEATLNPTDRGSDYHKHHD